jgi:hypothetical protein
VSTARRNADNAVFDLGHPGNPVCELLNLSAHCPTRRSASQRDSAINGRDRDAGRRNTDADLFSQHRIDFGLQEFIRQCVHEWQRRCGVMPAGALMPDEPDGLRRPLRPFTPATPRHRWHGASTPLRIQRAGKVDTLKAWPDGAPGLAGTSIDA